MSSFAWARTSAFLGGMINYILNNDKYFKQYVIDSTNGPTVVGERFGFSDGLFSGFNADKKSYDKKTWAFEMDANGVPVRDETLTHPRCVLQLLKKHYDRYTLDKVSETTGTPKEDLLRVYETFASTGAPDKAGTIMYAMGWTQKSVGVQNIRAHVHHPAPARQHRRGGRRRQRAARRIQRAGFHRPGAPCGHLARLPARCPLPR